MNKKEILREIRRTAEANGGKPLGWRKFESETGIKYSDWHGKHWVRWNDAIREAGLVPNQPTRSYDSFDLLDKYAQLTRELGRLPVSGDLRMRARHDPEFPHDRPFRRFGGKSALIGRVLEFCRGRSGYEDVVRLCEEYIAGQPQVRDDAECGQEEIGFVYLIKSGRFYKIGKSNAPGRREYELATQLPETTRTIHTIRTDDPSGIEAYWHKRFEAKRKEGEWFNLSAADIAAFKRRKFM